MQLLTDHQWNHALEKGFPFNQQLLLKLIWKGILGSGPRALAICVVRKSIVPES